MANTSGSINEDNVITEIIDISKKIDENSNLVERVQDYLKKL